MAKKPSIWELLESGEPGTVIGEFTITDDMVDKGIAFPIEQDAQPNKSKRKPDKPKKKASKKSSKKSRQ